MIMILKGGTGLTWFQNIKRAQTCGGDCGGA